MRLSSLGAALSFMDDDAFFEFTSDARISGFVKGSFDPFAISEGEYLSFLSENLTDGFLEEGYWRAEGAGWERRKHLLDEGFDLGTRVSF